MNKRVAKQKLDQATKNYRDKKKAEEKAEKQEEDKRKETAKMLDEQIIEISPLAFMRGRTFKNAYIVADEMQNATPNQMKMLLTRIGEGSKIVVTGDVKQTDRKVKDNGLLDFMQLVQTRDSNHIESVQFSHKDIERHPAVTEVLAIYGDND